MADIDKILNQAPTETIEESAEIIESNPSDLSQLEVETEEEGSEVLSLGEKKEEERKTQRKTSRLT